MAWAASAALVSLGDEPSEGRHRPPVAPARHLPCRNPSEPIRSMQSARSRSAAACSIPTASRSPAPRSTSGITRESGWGSGRPRPRRASGAAWRRATPTAGSTSTWTRRRATGPTATIRPGTRRRSRPSRRDSGRPGSRPARCSRGVRRRCGWSATTCRSAAAWSIRRAGPIAGVTVRRRRIVAVNAGVDLDALLASGELRR